MGFLFKVKQEASYPNTRLKTNMVMRSFNLKTGFSIYIKNSWSVNKELAKLQYPKESSWPRLAELICRILKMHGSQNQGFYVITSFAKSLYAQSYEMLKLQTHTHTYRLYKFKILLRHCKFTHYKLQTLDFERKLCHIWI